MTVHNPSVFLSQLISTAVSKTCLVMGDLCPQTQKDIVWHDPNDQEDFLEDQSDALSDTADDNTCAIIK